MFYSATRNYFARRPAPRRAPGPERRRSGRVRPELLYCNLGPVLNISRGGVRVLSSRRLRGGLRVALLPGEGRRVTFPARVRWSRRLGFFRHEVGLEFAGLDGRDLQTVRRLALLH